jgi:putative photosynthetic complex assembly protein
MGDPFRDTTLPRGALLGAAALVGLSLIGATISRLYGVSATPAPPAAVVEMRELRFDDRADGAVVVTDARTGEVQVMAPGTNGFMRGVLRGLAQERLRQHEGGSTPFRLTHWSDGRLSLTDPVTGRNVYLEAFGPTNAGAFAALLDKKP